MKSHSILTAQNPLVRFGAYLLYTTNAQHLAM